jgi:cytochrome c oxidase cbb3-type subunit 1
MWAAGLMQGLMWRTFNDDGTLTYTFIEVLKRTEPFYMLRLLGGAVFLSGMFFMVWNVYKTWQNAPNRNKAVAIPQPA